MFLEHKRRLARNCLIYVSFTLLCNIGISLLFQWSNFNIFTFLICSICIAYEVLFYSRKKQIIILSYNQSKLTAYIISGISILILHFIFGVFSTTVMVFAAVLTICVGIVSSYQYLYISQRYIYLKINYRQLIIRKNIRSIEEEKGKIVFINKKQKQKSIYTIPFHSEIIHFLNKSQ